MIKKLIFWIIGWVILYLVFFRLLPYLGSKGAGCDIHHDVYIQSLKIKVENKLIDYENHAQQTIVYLDENSEEKKLILLDPEFGAMYPFTNVGDSIIKEKNSIYYKVKSKITGKDTLYKFYTLCQDSDKVSYNSHAVARFIPSDMYNPASGR